VNLSRLSNGSRLSSAGSPIAPWEAEWPSPPPSSSRCGTEVRPGGCCAPRAAQAPPCAETSPKRRLLLLHGLLLLGWTAGGSAGWEDLGGVLGPVTSDKWFTRVLAFTHTSLLQCRSALTTRAADSRGAAQRSKGWVRSCGVGLALLCRMCQSHSRVGGTVARELSGSSLLADAIDLGGRLPEALDVLLDTQDDSWIMLNVCLPCLVLHYQRWAGSVPVEGTTMVTSMLRCLDRLAHKLRSKPPSFPVSVFGFPCESLPHVVSSLVGLARVSHPEWLGVSSGDNPRVMSIIAPVGMAVQRVLSAVALSKGQSLSPRAPGRRITHLKRADPHKMVPSRPKHSRAVPASRSTSDDSDGVQCLVRAITPWLLDPQAQPFTKSLALISAALLLRRQPAPSDPCAMGIVLSLPTLSAAVSAALITGRGRKALLEPLAGTLLYNVPNCVFSAFCRCRCWESVFPLVTTSLWLVSSHLTIHTLNAAQQQAKRDAERLLAAKQRAQPRRTPYRTASPQPEEAVKPGMRALLVCAAEVSRRLRAEKWGPLCLDAMRLVEVSGAFGVDPLLQRVGRLASFEPVSHHGASSAEVIVCCFAQALAVAISESHSTGEVVSLREASSTRIEGGGPWLVSKGPGWGIIAITQAAVSLRVPEALSDCFLALAACGPTVAADIPGGRLAAWAHLARTLLMTLSNIDSFCGPLCSSEVLDECRSLSEQASSQCRGALGALTSLSALSSDGFGGSTVDTVRVVTVLRRMCRRHGMSLRRAESGKVLRSSRAINALSLLRDGLVRVAKEETVEADDAQSDEFSPFSRSVERALCAGPVRARPSQDFVAPPPISSPRVVGGDARSFFSEDTSTASHDTGGAASSIEEWSDSSEEEESASEAGDEGVVPEVVRLHTVDARMDSDPSDSDEEVEVEVDEGDGAGIHTNIRLQRRMVRALDSQEFQQYQGPLRLYRGRVPVGQGLEMASSLEVLAGKAVLKAPRVADVADSDIVSHLRSLASQRTVMTPRASTVASPEVLDEVDPVLQSPLDTLPAEFDGGEFAARVTGDVEYCTTQSILDPYSQPAPNSPLRSPARTGRGDPALFSWESSGADVGETVTTGSRLTDRLLSLATVLQGGSVADGAHLLMQLRQERRMVTSPVRGSREWRAKRPRPERRGYKATMEAMIPTRLDPVLPGRREVDATTALAGEEGFMDAQVLASAGVLSQRWARAGVVSRATSPMRHEVLASAGKLTLGAMHPLE
jgi:hypothetical protein